MSRLTLFPTRINSIGEFRQLRDLHNKSKEKWVFRGQYCAEWNLQASFFRTNNFDEFTKKCNEYFSNNSAERLRIEDAYEYEIKLLLDDYYRRNQRAEYIPRCSIMDCSADYKMFLKKASEYSNDGRLVLPVKITVPFLSYCQHYGIPTRLLDFSFSPDVSIVFSQHGNDNPIIPPGKYCDSAIFAVNIYDDIGLFAKLSG